MSERSHEKKLAELDVIMAQLQGRFEKMGMAPGEAAIFVKQLVTIGIIGISAQTNSPADHAATVAALREYWELRLS